jgi:hypothetical protein
MIASKVICNDTYSNKSLCVVSQGIFPLHEIGPYPSHYTLPTPSAGPFAHPKPSTSNIPTAIPSFGPGAPPSPPSNNTPIPPEKSSRRSSVDPYPTLANVPQLPTPPALHSNVPFPADSMSAVTPPNYTGDSAEIISTRSNTMQISGDNVSPPYHHHEHRKSSPPIPAHTKSHASIDTKHTSPKKTLSGHQHSIPIKLNAANTFIHHYQLVCPVHSTSSCLLSATPSLSMATQRCWGPVYICLHSFYFLAVWYLPFATHSM